MVTLPEQLGERVQVKQDKKKKTKAPKRFSQWISMEIPIFLQRDFMEPVSLLLKQHFVLLHFVIYQK